MNINDNVTAFCHASSCASTQLTIWLDCEGLRFSQEMRNAIQAPESPKFDQIQFFLIYEFAWIVSIFNYVRSIIGFWHTGFVFEFWYWHTRISRKSSIVWWWCIILQISKSMILSNILSDLLQHLTTQTSATNHDGSAVWNEWKNWF